MAKPRDEIVTISNNSEGDGARETRVRICFSVFQERESRKRQSRWSEKWWTGWAGRRSGRTGGAGRDATRAGACVPIHRFRIRSEGVRKRAQIAKRTHKWSPSVLGGYRPLISFFIVDWVMSRLLTLIYHVSSFIWHCIFIFVFPPW